jgi:hypothetical protein
MDVLAPEDPYREQQRCFSPRKVDRITYRRAKESVQWQVVKRWRSWACGSIGWRPSIACCRALGEGPHGLHAHDVRGQSPSRRRGADTIAKIRQATAGHDDVSRDEAAVRTFAAKDARIAELVAEIVVTGAPTPLATPTSDATTGTGPPQQP